MVGPAPPAASSSQRSQRAATLRATTSAAAITDELGPSAFDPTHEYSTDSRLVLFWPPSSILSQWLPSTFVVDDVFVLLRGAINTGWPNKLDFSPTAMRYLKRIM